MPVESAHESFALIASAVAARAPAEVARRAARVLERAALALDDAQPPSDRVELPPDAERLVRALLAPDPDAVQRILEDKIAKGDTPDVIADSILLPAMTEVGALWARNLISVAQEHRATALAQTALARLSGRTLPRGASGRARRAVLACVEGNLHALGARAVADAFEHDGWIVDYLGADVPTRDLVAFLRDRPADLVGLSVSMPYHLESAKRVVAALRRELGEACPRIVVGGRPVRLHADGARVVEADALFPDATSVVASLRS